MFEDLYQIIQDKHENILKIEKLLEHIKQNEDLYDAEDMEKVSQTYQIRCEEYASMNRNFQYIVNLYREQVAGLEEKITRRQEMLESIDADVGAISSEPVLSDHFVKKQAHLKNNFKQIKAYLCGAVKEQLLKSMQNGQVNVSSNKKK